MFLFVALILALQFAFPGIASAETPLNPCANPANVNLDICKAAGFQFADAIGVIIQFLFVIGVILALFFLVYGGIRWITSGGDKAGVETARNTIIAAIIGLVLIFLAYIILNLVLTFLTGDGIGGIEIPTLSELGGGGNGVTDDARCGEVNRTVCTQTSPPCKFGGAVIEQVGSRGVCRQG